MLDPDPDPHKTDADPKHWLRGPRPSCLQMLEKKFSQMGKNSAFF
jgi:hypothetical protein